MFSYAEQFQPNHTSSRQQEKHGNTQGCTFGFYKLLMMGGKTARNM
jgi:hypothetical protein